MFNNRALHVRMIKTNDNNTLDSSETCNHFDLDKINFLVQENGKRIVVAVVGVHAAITALHTASEIAINAAPKR